MTREDIIRMAREAGAGEPESLYGRTDYVVMTWFELERFANFVAAAEREACAKVAELVAQEIDDTNGTATYIAKAIRAKGET